MSFFRKLDGEVENSYTGWPHFQVEYFTLGRKEEIPRGSRRVRLKIPPYRCFQAGFKWCQLCNSPHAGGLLYASGLALRREGVKQQRGWMLLEQWTCNHCTIGRKQHQQDHSTSYLPAAGSAHDSGLSGPILTHPLCSLLRLADVFQTQITRVPGEPAAPALPGKTLLRAPALESVERCWCSPGTQQLRSK